jgi:hypothetical protein
MKQKDLKQSATKVYTEIGDAIRGEKITAQYRTMHKPIVLAGSSTHQIQQCKMEGTVFCIIERLLNYLRSQSPKGAV